MKQHNKSTTKYIAECNADGDVDIIINGAVIAQVIDLPSGHLLLKDYDDEDIEFDNLIDLAHYLRADGLTATW